MRRDGEAEKQVGDGVVQLRAALSRASCDENEKIPNDLMIVMTRYKKSIIIQTLTLTLTLIFIITITMK